MFEAWFTIMGLGYIQNIAFSMVSRARNRDNQMYHASMAVLSNGIWFLTMRELVVADLTLWLLIPYVIGTVAGSLTGSNVSMKIERAIGAKAD